MNNPSYKSWEKWGLSEAAELLIGWTLLDMLQIMPPGNIKHTMILDFANPKEYRLKDDDQNHLSFALMIICCLSLDEKGEDSLFYEFKFDRNDNNQLYTTEYQLSTKPSVQKFLEKIRKKSHPLAVLHSLRKETFIGN